MWFFKTNFKWSQFHKMHKHLAWKKVTNLKRQKNWLRWSGGRWRRPTTASWAGRNPSNQKRNDPVRELQPGAQGIQRAGLVEGPRESCLTNTFVTNIDHLPALFPPLSPKTPLKTVSPLGEMTTRYDTWEKDQDTNISNNKKQTKDTRE